VDKRDRLHLSHLWGGEGVYRLLSQDAVALAQPSPYLADGLVRLLLGCAVDPGLEVLIRIDTEMLTIPESMLSVTRAR